MPRRRERTHIFLNAVSACVSRIFALEITSILVHICQLTRLPLTLLMNKNQYSNREKVGQDRLSHLARCFTYKGERKWQNEFHKWTVHQSALHWDYIWKAGGFYSGLERWLPFQHTISYSSTAHHEKKSEQVSSVQCTPRLSFPWVMTQIVLPLPGCI